ncbi:hypothetical protein ACQEVS_02490 [Streptomyces sp. CA-181903]|uniref:hypothetical protein n=1 Tax=Streptomyces sp. CA-181903 TaxID=3240055 RepID=UPI003D8C8AFF
MDALRRTGLLTAAALCAALATIPALADAPSAARVPADAPTPSGSPAPAAVALSSAPLPVAAAEAADSPDALRRVAADALRVLDQDAIGQRAAEAAAVCGAVRSPSAEQRRACDVVRKHLDVLVAAHTGLREQAAAPAPDRAAVARIVADAQRVRDELAPPAADGTGGGPLSRAAEPLGVLAGLATGLVGSLTGLVTGLFG